jgi:hypothetical protein
MAYATASDVQSEFRNADFSASNAAVSTAEVTEFLVQEEAIINGQIGGVYSVPVSSSSTIAVSILKAILIMRVKSRICSILAVKTGDPKGEQGNASTELKEKSDKLVELIIKRELHLYDASPAVTAVHSYTNAEDLTHVFKREEDQW